MQKEFTVRELTTRGWKRREDLDFRDDGTKFKGFESPEGLPLTYTKANGEYYLSLRVDYLNELTYHEYSKMESYSLCDEFNGVEEVDPDKLTQNATQIMREYNELVAEMNNYTVDMQKLVKSAEKELEIVYRILFNSNLGIDDLENVDTYEMNRLIDYRKSLKRQAESMLNRLATEQYTQKELRNLEENLDKYGYLTINEKDSFYIREIRRIVAKIRRGE